MKTPPKQQQLNQPGRQAEMNPQPVSIRSNYKGSEKLLGKVAIVTGGDSGIGRSVCLHFAREGADCVVVYLNENKDAKKTQELVEKEGRQCLLIKADVSKPSRSKFIVSKTLSKFGKIDILVNNAAVQYPKQKLQDISDQQWEETFRVNVFAYFYLSKAALAFMKPGSCIVNTTSVTAYRGSQHLIDYSATKGAIVSFTRSLSLSLINRKIRVNAVAPGPIWTPLIPATFDEDQVGKFGQQVPMKRVGQPQEVAPSYVFLASEDSSYISGQVVHPNGGEIIGS